MNTYTVHFEVFGKKFTVRKVKAKSEEDARYMVLGKVKFHSVKQENSDVVNDIFNMFR